MEKLVIFEEEIHDGLSIWPVVKTFQFENYLVVLTKNQNPKSEYYLSTYRYYIFIESGQQLSFHVENQFAKSKKSIILEPAELLIPEKDFSISLDDLARSYFTTYYFKPGRKLLDYAPLYHPLELTENGDIHIDGQHFQFVRAYKNFGLTARIGGKDTIMFEGEELILDENPFNIYANYIFELQDKEKRFLFWYTGKSLGGPQIHFNHPNTFPYRETRFRQDHATSQNKFIPLQQLLFIYFYESLIILIPLLIAIFILYRTIILPRRLKNRLTALQFEGIKSQLNPHFLFNSMASIQSLMNQRKAKEANRYLNELSDLLRYHLDTGAEELVPLSEELSAIEHYCELEKLRSPFELNFEIDQGIDPDRLEIPNQLLQPIVENAIKHGLRKVDDPKLRIRVQQLEKSFSILIEDNGPGIGSKEKVVSNQLPTSRKTHKGMGLVQEKISLLKKRGIKVKFAIEDRQKDLEEMESGTKVNIELPLNY